MFPLGNWSTTSARTDRRRFIYCNIMIKKQAFDNKLTETFQSSTCFFLSVVSAELKTLQVVNKLKAETMSFVILFCVAGCMIPNLVISTNQSTVSFAMKVLSKWNKFGKQMLGVLGPRQLQFWYRSFLLCWSVESFLKMVNPSFLQVSLRGDEMPVLSSYGNIPATIDQSSNCVDVSALSSVLLLSACFVSFPT